MKPFPRGIRLHRRRLRDRRMRLPSRFHCPQTTRPPTGRTITWQDEGSTARTPRFRRRSGRTTSARTGAARSFEYDTTAPERLLNGAGRLRIVAKQEAISAATTSARILRAACSPPGEGPLRGAHPAARQRGIWPAFWLLRNDIGSVGWPSCGEIDIMDYRSQPTPEEHGQPAAPAIPAAALTSTFAADRHVQRRLPRVRGQMGDRQGRTGSWTTCPYQTHGFGRAAGGRWVFEHPFFIILNVAVGGTARQLARRLDVFPQRCSWTTSACTVILMFTRARLRGLASAWTLTATLAGAAISARSAAARRQSTSCRARRAHLVSQGSSSWVHQLQPSAGRRVIVGPRSGVYEEPLFVFSSVQSKQVPWLAVDRQWLDGNRTLPRLTRDSVLWSDSRPFSAKDVEFTFRLLKRFPRARPPWRCGASCPDVTARDAHGGTSRSSACSSRASSGSRRSRSCPKHVWNVKGPGDVRERASRRDRTVHEVNVFREPDLKSAAIPLLLAEEGKPAITALRFPAYPSNDRADLALVFVRSGGRATSFPRSSACS